MFHLWTLKRKQKHRIINSELTTILKMGRMFKKNTADSNKIINWSEITGRDIRELQRKLEEGK